MIIAKWIEFLCHTRLELRYGVDQSNHFDSYTFHHSSIASCDNCSDFTHWISVNVIIWIKWFSTFLRVRKSVNKIPLCSVFSMLLYCWNQCSGQLTAQGWVTKDSSAVPHCAYWARDHFGKSHKVPPLWETKGISDDLFVVFSVTTELWLSPYSPHTRGFLQDKR